jgi:hypothetical protein
MDFRGFSTKNLLQPKKNTKNYPAPAEWTKKMKKCARAKP